MSNFANHSLYISDETILAYIQGQDYHHTLRFFRLLDPSRTGPGSWNPKTILPFTRIWIDSLYTLVRITTKKDDSSLSCTNSAWRPSRPSLPPRAARCSPIVLSLFCHRRPLSNRRMPSTAPRRSYDSRITTRSRSASLSCRAARCTASRTGSRARRCRNACRRPGIRARPWRTRPRSPTRACSTAGARGCPPTGPPKHSPFHGSSLDLVFLLMIFSLAQFLLLLC